MFRDIYENDEMKKPDVDLIELLEIIRCYMMLKVEKEKELIVILEKILNNYDFKTI